MPTIVPDPCPSLFRGVTDPMYGKTATRFRLCPMRLEPSGPHARAMQRTILVGTDGSPAAEAALRLAVELARAAGDRVLLVTVWRELRGDFGIPLHRLIPQLLDVEREWASATLEAASAEVAAAGVPVERVCRHGLAGPELCAIAAEREARLLVVGNRGWGAEAALVGSVAKHVVKHAPCSVLLVPSAAGSQHGDPALRTAVQERLELARGRVAAAPRSRSL
jgi:nucleotide-binding universal stress UspA family protein